MVLALNYLERQPAVNPQTRFDDLLTEEAKYLISPGDLGPTETLTIQGGTWVMFGRGPGQDDTPHNPDLNAAGRAILRTAFGFILDPWGEVTWYPDPRSLTTAWDRVGDFWRSLDGPNEPRRFQAMLRGIQSISNLFPDEAFYVAMICYLDHHGDMNAMAAYWDSPDNETGLVQEVEADTCREIAQYMADTLKSAQEKESSNDH